MRRRFLVVAGLVIGLVAALWLWRRPAAPRAPAPAAPAATRRAAAPAPASREARLAGWLLQRGIPPRRIAGRVVHRGQPVPRATVTLRAKELLGGELVAAQVVANLQGEFDLGPRAATRWLVVGETPELAAAYVDLDLRKPGGGVPPPDALVIELLDCELTVSGTVRDAGGGVIAAAEVRGARQRQGFGHTVADEQGRYRLCFSAGVGHVEARAAGYGAAFQHINARRDTRVDFELSPEVVIAGRVVDASQAPVAGATVIAAVNDHDPGALTESDDDGAFRLEGLVPGDYRVVARDEQRVVEKTVGLPSAGMTQEIVLALVDGRSLAGRVVADGQPLVGARLSVHPTAGPWLLGSAVTQAGGRFAIDGLPRAQVLVRVEGYRVVSGPSLDLATPEKDVEIVCERLATVSGIVRLDGRPVAGADVQLHGPASQYARSRADGSFEIIGALPGRYAILADSPRDAARAPPRDLDVGAGDVRDVEVELARGASVSGVVVDSTGAPMAGVSVMLMADRDVGTGTTGDDGAFEIDGLRSATTYRVQLNPRARGSSWMRDGSWIEYPSRPSGPAYPSIAIGETNTRITGVRLVAAFGTRTITGRVVRPSGEPVMALQLVARADGGQPMSFATVGADGSFAFSNLRPGRYAIYVAIHGPEEHPVVVEAGATNVVIELAPLGIISGTLRGFLSTPLIVARRVDVPMGFASGPAQVSGDRFTITSLPAGSYEVLASSDDGVATARATVIAGQAATIALEATRRAHLTGVVTDSRTGAPLAGVRCVGRSAHPSPGPLPEPSDASGAFTVDLPPGRVTVDCFLDGPPAAPLRDLVLELEPGANARVAVEMLVAQHTREWRAPPGYFVNTDGGVRLVELPPGGGPPRPAGRALQIDDRPVDGLSMRAMMLLLVDRPPGTTARVLVERDGAMVTVELPL